MDKQVTDFALMAGAFSKDHKMATQVCRLLADGDVNEATARKMLRLVTDGKLASETPTCSHWHLTYPHIWTNGHTYSYTSYPAINTASTLTDLANTVVASAA